MLQEQIASVDFTQGLDKKSDEKLVLPGKLTRCENSGFESGNTLSKMGGYTLESDGSLVGGGTIGSAERLMKLGAEVLIQSAGSLYSYGGAGLVERSEVPTWGATKRPVVRNNATQSGFDVGVAGDIEVYVWQDSRGGLRATVRDSVKGTLYQSDVSISSTGVLPRCLSDGSAVYVIYLEGTNLRIRSVGSDTPDTFRAAVTIVNDAATSSVQMDALYDDASTYFYAAYRSSSNVLAVCRFNADGTVDASTTASENPTRGLCVGWYSSDNLLGVFDHENSSGNLNARIFDADLTLSAGPTTVDTAASGVFVRMCTLSTAGGASLRLFYEEQAASPEDTLVKVSNVSRAAVASSASAYQRGAGLAACPFGESGSEVLAFTVESSAPNLQPTVLVADAISEAYPRIRARLMAGVGGGLLTAARVPNVPLNSQSRYLLAVNEKGRLTVETAGGGSTIIDKTPEGISVEELDPDADLQALAVGDELFLCGACPSVYDGRGVVEAGFHLFPDPPTVTLDIGTGVATAGTYSCVLVYEWTDNRGRRWVSAPSSAVQVTAAANDAFDWEMPTLRFTAKRATFGHAEVRIVPYRTEADGAIYYRVATPEDAPENDVTADSVTFTDDSLTDSDLISREPLYSQATLDAGPIPPCRTACIHQNRVALAQLEDTDRIALSLQMRDGEGLRFNEAMRYAVPSDGTDLESLVSQERRLYALREGGILAWDGDPPNDAGGGSDFTEPRVVSPDVGCTNFRSLVETPDGWMFESEKGRYLLARNEQVVYLGADVETFTDAAVAAVCLRSKNHARWYTAAGTTLVYDWTFRQWSTLTNHAAVGAVEWDGAAAHLDSSGSLYRETGYTHNGTAISQVWETGWMKLAGLNGFQRVWQMLLVGQSYSGCTLTVDVAFDFGGYTEQFAVNVGTAFGTSEVPLALRHHISQQKCTAVRFRITESASQSPHQGVRLTEMSLSVGVKKGPRKFSAAKTF